MVPVGGRYALPGDCLDAAEWRRVFLRTGGMRHLLSLLGRDNGSGGNGIDPSLVGGCRGGLVVVF